MSDVKDLLDEAVGSYEPRTDQRAVELRVERHRQARRVATGFVALGVFMVAGWFAWSAFRPFGSTLGSPDSGTYVLSDFEVSPHVDPGTEEVDAAHADVTFTMDWSSDEYPGLHRCDLHVADAAGSQIGSLSFEMLATSQGHRNPKTVPIDGSTDGATATGSCSDERVDTPVAAIISDVRVQDALTVTFVVGWPDTLGADATPGANACTAGLYEGDKLVAKGHFTLVGGRGLLRTSISAPDQIPIENLAATVACVPYVHEGQFPDPKPPSDATASPDAVEVIVPGVVGLTGDEASASLEGAGMAVVVTSEPSNDIPEGLVASQDPPGGTAVGAGSSVPIVLSEGPQVPPDGGTTAPYARYYFVAPKDTGVLEVWAHPATICYSTQSYPARPIVLIAKLNGTSRRVASYRPQTVQYCDREARQELVAGLIVDPSSFAIRWSAQPGERVVETPLREIPK